jgi:hypothetical protein
LPAGSPKFILLLRTTISNLMPSYNLQVGTSSYTVNKSLILNLENYFHKDIVEILSITPGEFKAADKVIRSTIIHDSFGSESYSSINGYKLSMLRNDTKGITIEFGLDSELIRSFKITLRLGAQPENCDLAVSLDDPNARDKVGMIEAGVFSILDQHKNNNWILYPMEGLSTLIAVSSGICGLIAFGSKITDLTKWICGGIFWIGAFYLFCRLFKGYCIFETNKQKQLDKWFNWIVYGLLSFIVFATLLPSIRKHFVGF